MFTVRETHLTIGLMPPFHTFIQVKAVLDAIGVHIERGQIPAAIGELKSVQWETQVRNYNCISDWVAAITTWLSPGHNFKAFFCALIIMFTICAL